MTAERMKGMFSHSEINEIRGWFPSLDNMVDGKPCTYLDNAATTMKPRQVIDRVTRAYVEDFVSVHRSTYKQAEKTIKQYENARKQVKNFFNAGNEYEVIFTTGSTEGINLVAASYGDSVVTQKDEIIVSVLEHHSNYLPWKVLAKNKNAKFRTVLINEDGDLDFATIKSWDLSTVKIAALTHASNVTGKLQLLKDIIGYFHSQGVTVLVDGAQSAPHVKVDINDLNPDFFVCSAHKMLGPMGIGVLIVKKEILAGMKPWKLGGGMVLQTDQLKWKTGVGRFEAGTPNAIGIFGWMAALEVLEQIGMDRVHNHVGALTMQLYEGLNKLSGVQIYSCRNPKDNIGVVCFNVKGIHSHDVDAWLDHNQIAVRVGHHCAQPLMSHLGVEATTRASIYLYNNSEDIEKLLKALSNLCSNLD